MRAIIGRNCVFPKKMSIPLPQKVFWSEILPSPSPSLLDFPTAPGPFSLASPKTCSAMDNHNYLQGNITGH